MLSRSSLTRLGRLAQGLPALRSLSSAAPEPLTSAAPEMPPFDFTPPPYTGPSKEEVLATRKEFLSPALFHHFKNPVMIVDGKMQWLFDEHGRRYLDVS